MLFFIFNLTRGLGMLGIGIGDWDWGFGQISDPQPLSPIPIILIPKELFFKFLSKKINNFI